MARSLVSEEAQHWNLLTGVWTPGKVIYVDSGGSDTTGTGFTPTSPIKTINAAMDLCTANQGDVIQVMGNSPSTPNDTGTITMDKAGVTLRGLYGRGMLSDSGFGSDTTNVPCLTIAANYITVENLYLGIDPEGSSGGVIEGSKSCFGFTLRNCLIEAQYTTTYGFYTGVSWDFPYLLIEDCVFGSGQGAKATNWIRLFNASMSSVIRRNLFKRSSAAAIQCLSSCGELSILDNTFHLNSDLAGGAITLDDGSSQIYVDNNHAGYGTTDAADPYYDKNGNDDSNTWGLNYKGVTGTLPKLTA